MTRSFTKKARSTTKVFYIVSVRKLGYTQPPSRRDGMLVENTSPTS
ncbi:MAG: hypothetical protein LBD59_07785 [Prevotellaceae bacterium]|nr:hypothetical protein [Prevotellaceae bacterium]